MPNSTDPLDIARYLASSGVPIFLARRSDSYPEGGSDGRGYHLPPRWQRTKPDPAVLDDYEPGMAVCAVMGHEVDGLDLDPRSGGDLPTEYTPKVYGTQRTPSGGVHHLIAPLGVRSKDGVLPGVDVKAGHEGRGIGFLFIAPTERTSHETGEIGQYVWETEPDLTDLQLIGMDDSGSALAELIQSTRINSDGVTTDYTGPEYDQLPHGQQVMADTYVSSRLEVWSEVLKDAASWPDGERDFKGRGWEALTRDFAWTLASFAACPWIGLDDQSARAEFERLLPEPIANDPKCQGKWYEGLVEKASAAPVSTPPWSDFDPTTLDQARAAKMPAVFDDSALSSWMADIGLERKWAWSGATGWLEWNGQKWDAQHEVGAIDAVRRMVWSIKLRAIEYGADKDLMKKVDALQTRRRISDITSLMRGQVQIDPSVLDSHRDLLNVANGVVDLRTGRLMDHDPKYYFTKVSPVEYIPDAQHPDWDQSLKALEPEVVEWMRVRMGQAATGHPASDDVMPIGQGSGSNGKTTFISAIRTALGEFAVTVPDKLLRADPSSHPTELMTLLGARLALIDETPEAAQLDVPRLKSMLGSEVMTARALYKDNVSWAPTHSLMVVTNYVPQIREVDHGTWRRLALVKFDKTFPRDDRFRARLVRGDAARSSAVLAWLVSGAVSWYQSDKVMPPFPEKVKRDTQEWRGEVDVLSDFIADNLVFDPNYSISGMDLMEAINDHLRTLNQHPWSINLVSARLQQNQQFQQAGVRKVKQRRNSTQYPISYREGVASNHPTSPNSLINVWRGIRWAAPSELDAADKVRVDEEQDELL